MPSTRSVRYHHCRIRTLNNLVCWYHTGTLFEFHNFSTSTSRGRLEALRLVLYAERVAKQANKTKKAGKGGKAKDDDKNGAFISENRKARHNYTVLDTLECGIMLVGSEVKSLRIGGLSLDEAYASVKDDDVWLVGANIAEYKYSHGLNHEPKGAANCCCTVAKSASLPTRPPKKA